ncbi:uncharacterized protein ISCGN_032780 [Ixodes scapularis]
MRMQPALAFLSIVDIPEALQDLVEVFPTEAAPVADYFEDVYIGRPRRNGMSTAIFFPTAWFSDVLLSHVGTYCVDVVYTDFDIAAINVMKAVSPSAKIQGCFFHLPQSVYWKVCFSGLQSRYNADDEFAVKNNVGCSSFNIWVFLGCVKREQSLTEMKLSQAQGGNTSSMVSKKHADCNKRLQVVVSSRYDSRNRLETSEPKETFLLHDSGDGDSEKLLILATERNLSYLVRSTTWFADGTFKVTPEQFHQLYTVHAVVNAIVVPMVYGLLPNKSETTYRGFFDVLLSRVGTYCVEVVYTSTSLPSTPQRKIQGCFFHLSQSVYWKVCFSGLQSRYNADEEFAVKDLVEVFPTEAAPVADYFEDVYIGRPRRNGMSTAIFFPTAWSVRE